MSRNISSPLPIEVEALNNRICDWHGNLDVWHRLHRSRLESAAHPARWTSGTALTPIMREPLRRKASRARTSGNRLHRSRFESVAHPAH